MKKRIIALLSVLVLLITISSAAFAAWTKPTAALVTKNVTVKRGKIANFEFKLRSGSYTKLDGQFRSKLNVLILTPKKEQIGSASWVWTGDQRYQLRARISKKAVTGKYYLKYTTYFRSTVSAAWKKVKTKTGRFTVK